MCNEMDFFPVLSFQFNDCEEKKNNSKLMFDKMKAIFLLVNVFFVLD